MSDFWSYKLVEKLKSKSEILIKSESLAVIKDSYPKARFHFLILPFDDESLDNIYDLGEEHLSLLDEFELLAINVIEVLGNKTENFKIGFHAAPSMKRLHLHVLSKDFDSPCLKNKKHWNSFNTQFLVTIQEIRDDLKNTGSVQRKSDEEIKALLNTPLKCNTCSYKAKNIPDLKKHLEKHIPQYSGKIHPKK